MVNRLVSVEEQRRFEQGHEFERDFFGFSPTFDPDKIDFDVKKKKKIFLDNVRKVILSQRKLSWDPKAPKTWRAKNLYFAVKSQLPKTQKNEILLCCALGTTLDWIYGIDGFFVLESNPLGPITFNLARSDCKAQKKKLKANGLITPQDVSNHERIKRIGIITSHHLLRALRKRSGYATLRKLW